MADTKPVEELPVDLTHGGLLWRVLVRAGLAAPEAERAVRRAAALTLLAWLPPFVYCAVEGLLFRGQTQAPFLHDVSTQVRLLVVIPLLVAGEPVARLVWGRSVRRMVEEGFIPPERRGDLDREIRWALSWRDRGWPEALLLALSLLHTTARRLGAYGQTVGVTEGWFGTAYADGTLGLNFAGHWHLYVGSVIALFLSLRWVVRIVLWYVFLHRITRLDLRIQPLHADRAGGLSFLGKTLEAYTLVAFAWSASLCGTITNRILHSGAHLSEFYVTFGVFAGVGFLLLTLPLVGILLPRLVAARTAALAEFGRLTAEYGHRFADRWGRGVSRPTDGPLAEEPEMPQLSDFYTGMDVVREMKPLPLRIPHLVELAAAFALPALGPVLVSFPAEHVLRKLLELLNGF